MLQDFISVINLAWIFNKISSNWISIRYFEKARLKSTQKSFTQFTYEQLCQLD